MSSEILISIRVETANTGLLQADGINVILVGKDNNDNSAITNNCNTQPRHIRYSQLANIPSQPIELLRHKIKEMESGLNRNNGRKFSQATILQWKNFLRLLCSYEQTYTEISFEDIDSSFWDSFKQYCEQEGLMPKSINKYLAVFRALIAYAQSNGIKVSDTALSSYKKVPIFDDDIKAKTYLNEMELQALYDMKLTGLKDRVRDIFMLGCYLGQRVSDYNNLTRDDFTTTRRGNRVVSFTQEKTNNAVIVPIIYDNVYAIARKYDYNFPRISHGVINRCIKEILAELSVSVPSLRKTMRTAITLKEQLAEIKVE